MKLVLFFLFSLWVNNFSSGTIQVEVTNLRNSQGHVLVTLYDQPKGFPTEPRKALKRLKLTIKDGVAKGEFVNIPYGSYAFGILHDENDNGKLESNLLGIPKEGYGASNNAQGTFGPPKFDDAKFIVSNMVVKQKVKAFY